MRFYAARRRKFRPSKKSGKKALRPPVRIRDFQERARALVMEADGDLVRFTVNAGTARKRDSIVKLVRSLEMNLSQFFSALIERLCTEAQPNDSVGAAPVDEVVSDSTTIQDRQAPPNPEHAEEAG
jgi:hypothetical protein